MFLWSCCRCIVSRISWALYSILPCHCQRKRYHLLRDPEITMGNCPTPLRRAVRRDDYEGLQEILVEAGDRAAFLINEDYAPDCIMQSCSKTTGNAFYYTVFKRKIKMVELMIKYGADIYSTGFYEEPALHCAARGCCLEIVEMLVEAGADPQATDDMGRTALHAAARSYFNTSEILNYLLQEKMNKEEVNLKDFSGRTPLHDAAEFGTMRTVQTLVVLGADLNARTNAGEVPCDLALRNRTTDINTFLKEEARTTTTLLSVS